MNRLSGDALLVQAFISAGETVLVETIALEVFGEENESGYKLKTRIATHRAVTAVRCLVDTGRFSAIPNRRNPVSVTSSTKNTGLQMQSLMGMMCRAGVDRRKEDRGEDDRRGEDSI